MSPHQSITWLVFGLLGSRCFCAFTEILLVLTVLVRQGPEQEDPSRANQRDILLGVETRSDSTLINSSVRVRVRRGIIFKTIFFLVHKEIYIAHRK